MNFLKIVKKNSTFLLLFLFLIINCLGGDVSNLYQTIPKQILDWKAEDKDQTFDKKTIFKHINGGAELYLAYDFKQVFVRKYSGPGEDEIVLDIYDMGASTEAFGIFTSERDAEVKNAGIGQGSEYSDGLLRFWKDRFFVSILAIGDERTARSAIMELGKRVAGAIPSTGPEPEMLKFLPQKNLDKKRIRYFHTDLILNKHYYIANENILNLNKKTNCLLAEYKANDQNDQDSTYLLLIQYENNTQANQAYEKFLKIYMPEAKETGLAQMENQRWTMAKIEQNKVIIVFEAPDKNSASELQAVGKR
jgi:hypothetical protein